MWGVGCAVFCMVMGAVCVWWENRHRRTEEDEDE